MFDVKKLAKLLKEIFTRDNENFSPELVADELKRRSPEVFDYFAMDNASALPDMSGDNNAAVGSNSCYAGQFVSWADFERNNTQNHDDFHTQAVNVNGPEQGNGYRVVGEGAFTAIVFDLPIKLTRCVVIGNGSECLHNNTVVIGNNQKSDKPNQLKIGNNDISVSRDITDEEFREILATFKSVRDALPK